MTHGKRSTELKDKGLIRTLPNKGALTSGLCLECTGMLLYIEVWTFPNFVFSISKVLLADVHGADWKSKPTHAHMFPSLTLVWVCIRQLELQPLIKRETKAIKGRFHWSGQASSELWRARRPSERLGTQGLHFTLPLCVCLFYTYKNLEKDQNNNAM